MAMEPTEPTMPEDHECCGNECGTDCVWSLYFEDQKAYLAEKRAWDGRREKKNNNNKKKKGE